MASPLPLPPSSIPQIDPQTGALSEVWRRYYLALENAIATNAAPTDARYLVGTHNTTLTDEINLGALATGYIKATVAVGIATISTAATIPATDLSGTIADARLSSNVPLKDGTNVFSGANSFPAGASTTTVVPSGRVFSITAAVPTSGTTEEILATYTMKANTLNVNGQALRFVGSYTTAANGNNKTIKVRVGGIGGTVILTYTSATNAGSIWWDALLTRRTSTTAYGSGFATDGATSASTGSAATPTLTGDVDVVVTGTTGTSAGDMSLQQADAVYLG